MGRQKLIEALDPGAVGQGRDVGDNTDPGANRGAHPAGQTTAAGCAVTMPVTAPLARPNTTARSTQTALAGGLPLSGSSERSFERMVEADEVR